MGQSVIEINGKRYDASTGKVIADEPAMSPPKRPQTNGHNIDGVVSSKPSTALAPSQPVPSATHKITRDTSLVRPMKVHKTKTLMRTVVKKPTRPAPTSVVSPQVGPSPSYRATQSHSLARAHSVKQHSQVSHFARVVSPQKLQPTLVHNMPVRAPSAPKTHHHQPTHHAAPAAIPTQPSEAYVAAQLAKTASSLTAEEPLKKRFSSKRFTAKLKKHRIKSVASIALAVLLIGGFLVYQNLPTFYLALANREAGISAKMPKGVPSNFAINKVVGSEGGSVVMSYTSRADDRKFTLTQIKADATVKSLEESIAKTSGNQYQTYQAGGITLFMSPGDRVDWIDGEMRYNIYGTTGFSPDQVALIASSL